MIIAGIVQQTKHGNLCYDTSVYTFSELLSQSDGNYPLVIVLKDENESFFFYNLSTLVAEQPVYNQASDWESLTNYLNTIPSSLLDEHKCVTLVPSRMKSLDGDKIKYIQTPFCSNAQVELDIYSVENNNEVTVSYGSYLLPAVRNNKLIKWKLNDVVFTKNRNAKINFNNTIPFIDGVACFPYVYNDELYALEGSKLLTKNTSANKNIVLVDFSKFGNLTTYKLSDCEFISLTGFEEEDIPPSSIEENNDGIKQNITTKMFSDEIIRLKFTIPNNTKGIPFVSIFGRLFTIYNSDLIIYKQDINTTIVELSIPRFTLERIFVSNLQKFNKVIKGTNNIRVSIKGSIEDLFRNRALDINTTVNITNSSNSVFNDCNYQLIDVDARGTNRIWKHQNKSISFNTSLNRWEIKLHDEVYFYGKYQYSVNDEEVDDTHKCAPWSTNIVWRTSDDIVESIVVEHNVDETVAMKYADECIPFISILDTNQMINFTVQECRRTLGKDKLVFDKNAGGILINKLTKEVIDYTRVYFEDETLVTIASYKPLKLTTKEDTYSLSKDIIGFGNVVPVSSDKGFNYFDGYKDLKDLEQFVLVDISTNEILKSDPIIPDIPVEPPVEDDQGEDLDHEFDNEHTDHEIINPEIKDPNVIIEYVSVKELKVTSTDDETINGIYSLLDLTTAGLNRVWGKYNSDDPSVIDVVIAYDDVRHWWYIGTENNHIYESVVATTGSSPWHSTLTWTYIEPEDEGDDE